MPKRRLDPPRRNLARNLRRRQTLAERRLWDYLRNSQMDGHKFRRQHPIGKYIVDLVDLESRLVIEVDGGQHGEGSMRTRDDERTKWLENEGYRLLRFWNNEVFTNIEGVYKVIQHTLKRLDMSPSS